MVLESWHPGLTQLLAVTLYNIPITVEYNYDREVGEPKLRWKRGMKKPAAAVGPKRHARALIETLADPRALTILAATAKDASRSNWSDKVTTNIIVVGRLR